MKIMSAHSIWESFSGSTFRSIRRRSQARGNKLETVNKPRGGNAHRLPSNGSACRKLQYVSGNSGLINKTLITTRSLRHSAGPCSDVMINCAPAAYAYPCGATSGNGTKVPHEKRHAHHI